METDIQLVPEQIKIPDDWNYDKSVKRVKAVVYKWKNITAEIITELWIARERLKNSRERDTSGAFAPMDKTWKQYCKDIGFDKSTANRWLARYFPEEKQKIQLKDDQEDFEFAPLIYNIWNADSRDSGQEYFGAFPLIFMLNLLHYHTEENDLVLDPFAGSGTTIKACQMMKRKCLVSDLNPTSKQIKKHDASNGLPKLPRSPDLLFLDPPYWKQAENKYSKEETDLGNMSIKDFYDSMRNIFKDATDNHIKKIAIVIQPTQIKNNWIFEDHVFRFHEMLLRDYKIEMRYILPYSTQQYLPQHVIRSKEEKVCLALNRDLIIWSMK